MSIDRHFSITQFTWLMGTFLGLVVAVFLGSAVGSQDFRIVTVVLGAGIGIGTFLILGKNYWMLIPFSLGATFPAVPMGGRSIEFPELAIAGCFVFFLLRIATRKEQLHVFHSVNVPFLLFMAWVGMIFVLNPIGFAMLGSQTGGARFYIKIFLAFAAFFIMSSRTYTERDIRWIIGFLIFGAFFSLVYGFAEYAMMGPQVDPVTGMVADEFYTWHQLLAAPPATIAFLIFARWSPRQVFSLRHVPLIVSYLLCIGLVLLSGKRMALVAVFLAPLVSAIMNKQFAYIFAGTFLAVAMLGVITVGQGQWFNLPVVAQRTVSWLPGEWAPELQKMGGGTDEWRAELRRVARVNIQRDPWIGRGFSVDLSETMTAIMMQRNVSGIEAQAASYALGRSWHNRWLGYAADFGIPLSVIQGILYLCILLWCGKLYGAYGNKSFHGVFALYVLIYTLVDVVASHTSGHTSNDAFARWWMYGLVVALYLKVKKPAQPTRATQGATHTSVFESSQATGVTVRTLPIK
jgi:hypothetical protein